MKSRHWIAAAALAMLSAASWAEQVHMEAALASLQQAKDSLNKASADKGGHRVRALQLVENAIKQVNAGIEYDKTHKESDEGKGKKPAKPAN